MFYLSPHHFGELFHEGTGLTLKRYHFELRMQEARALLLRNERNVTQIAEHLGFDSVHSFSKRFKAFTGLSPLAFRRERQRR